MNDQKERLLSLLGLGPGAAVKAAVLSDDLGMSHSGADRTVKLLIEDMVLNDGALIGAVNHIDGGPMGYYLLQTADQVIDYTQRLRSRSNAINRRADALLDTWKDQRSN